MREKKFIYFTGSIALVVASLLGLKAVWYLYRSEATLPVNRSITVSAEGRSTVAPDLARLSFAVISEGEDPEKLQSENSQKMNASVEFVKSQGIDSKTSRHPIIIYSRAMSMMKRKRNLLFPVTRFHKRLM